MQPERAQLGIQRETMCCGFSTACGVVSVPDDDDTQRTGDRWKPLVFLAGRALRSCFVRLCVSEGRFVRHFSKLPP
jgi:hypothetical protein